METTCKYCFRKVHANGMCEIHNRRLIRSKIDEKKIKEVEDLLSKNCCLTSCRKPSFSSGLCHDHFQEVLKYGHPISLNKTGYENFDPDKANEKTNCAVKRCRAKSEKGSWLCEGHGKQFKSIRDNKNSYEIPRF
ncbi:MAG: hypothetical protein ABEH43_02215 [Flavobacteriales bacterium]